jgi:hypothetical protein
VPVSQAVEEQAARRPASLPLAARLAAVLMTGLLAGAVTSILQKYLGSPWDSLVNAASPWLAAMFAAGAAWMRPARCLAARCSVRRAGRGGAGPHG